MQRRAIPATQAGRSHGWLPDANLDAHPLGTWMLQLGFDLSIRAAYRRVIMLPPDFHIAPGTLIASNHQRDVDGPMLGTVLVRRTGLRFQWPLPFYATREDLFRPGILARLTVHWPRPVSALLGLVSLAWFFPLGRTEPIRRVREFTLGETLHALCNAGCGDADLWSLLNARGRRETGIHPGEFMVRAALSCRDLPIETFWGVRRLTLSAFEKIAPAFRATIDAQLGHFAERLNRGRCVYFSPEGTISVDGRFGRTRAGFFRLARLTRSPPCIQPMALAYDALAAGRARVVVHVGECFRADPSLGRHAFDATLRRAVLDLVPITPSHLLARFLLHGPVSFAREDLIDWLARGLRALRAAHPSMDPLFASRNLHGLTDQRLRWLERKGLVLRVGERFRNTCARDADPGWRTPPNVVRYLDNSLSDLVPDVARALPC